MRYALVNPSNQITTVRADIDPNVSTKAGWRWLPCPEVTIPSFDPATQVRTGPTFTISASTVTEVWTVRAMTAQELAALKTARVAAIDEAQFKVLFNHENRLRALEGKAVISAATFRAAIEALI